ncbi:hypothetical protein J6590_089055 [Homalodisca vitripennis]|nr:hypothetical protein J6590_089055 [Homalodisca vitripennis]
MFLYVVFDTKIFMISGLTDTGDAGNMPSSLQRFMCVTTSYLGDSGNMPTSLQRFMCVTTSYLGDAGNMPTSLQPFPVVWRSTAPIKYFNIARMARYRAIMQARELLRSSGRFSNF